ncbi:MAG: response regulator [Candidatus Deferrimicrobium sp.]
MPKKLLLAEDSLTIRKVFELALSRSDIAVTAVDNGEDAVRLAGEILPDLVVADLTLPGKNGFAVAAELRTMEQTEKIPVLILSGTLVPLDEARYKASGARGVLFKPFESRELLENIERLLREETSVPESRKQQEAPAIDERWDFSDVLNEVEAEAGKSAAPAPAAREGLLPGAILPGGGNAPPAFNEFDVSIDEIEGSERDFSAEPSPPASAAEVEHIESDLSVDSPSPVTDLSPAMDEVEEIEEIENLEEVEVPLPPSEAVSSGTPASLRIFPVAEEPVPVPPASSVAPPDAGYRPGDAELREFFAGRAAEIFRTVASEAVEKVMWEMTDRLAAEFSAKLRESVEAVAWEVIPSTAEALIREEIARIRGQAGKPSP